MPKKVTETARVLEAIAGAKPGHRFVQLISPGWGSSGYYAPAVLETAVSEGLFPAGIHMHADHPTEEEQRERPGRSIKDLISVTVGEGHMATDSEIKAGADEGGVVAEIKVMAPYRELIDDLAETVGVSILGDASDITVGEAEGRSGPIIEGLSHVESVDWVTRAGRGGKVLSLLESARVNRRAIGHGLKEATVNDTREALQTVLRDAYGGDKTWVWVRDFDETTVWFEIEAEGDESGVYGQTYTDSDGAVALSGDRTEVRVSTKYVPVTRPDSKDKPATESEEDTMPKIQIEESEHTALTEKAGRVDALVSENATLKADNEKLVEATAAAGRTARATELIKESEHSFLPLEARALLVDLPVVEAEKDGAKVQVLDETAFGERLTEAAKESAATLAATGGLHGFGASAGTTEVAESGAPKTSAWGRPLAESKGA